MYIYIVLDRDRDMDKERQTDRWTEPWSWMETETQRIYTTSGAVSGTLQDTKKPRTQIIIL